METENAGNLCEPHLTVNFTFINKNFTAYLDYNNILRPYVKTSCLYPFEHLNQVYYLKKSTKIIVREGRDIQIINNNEKSIAKAINFEGIDISKLNFKHSKTIKDGFDLAKEFKSFFNHFDRDTSAKSDWFHILKYFLFFFSFLLFLLGIIYLLINYSKIKIFLNHFTGGRDICKSFRKKNKKNKKEEFIELKNLGKRESFNSFESNYKTKPLIANKNYLGSLHKTVQTESIYYLS
jgi:hypothetical protein